VHGGVDKLMQLGEVAMATSSQRIVRGFGIYEVMKEHRPAKLVAFDADGDPVTINVPEIRQRHARVLEALKGIAWTRVDLFDKKGGLLCRHQRNADDRDAVATDLEELGPGPTTRVAELAGLVSIMLRAQEAVLNSTQRQMQGVFEAQNRIMDAMLRRFDLQERQHQEAMELNHQLSADLVAAQLGRLSAPQAVDAEGNPRPESDRAISALMPQIFVGEVAPNSPELGRRFACVFRDDPVDIVAPFAQRRDSDRST
jgi:hypothetical protein